MVVRRSLKSALLAAASLSAAGVMATADAQGATPEAEPSALVETVAVAGEAAAAPAEKGWAGKVGVFAAIALGAAAGLMRWKHFKPVADAVVRAAPHVAKAAGVAARTSAKVIKTAGVKVGGWLGGPLRRIAVLAGLFVAAIAGVGFYNIEWAGGMLVGGGLVAAAWRGSAGVKRAFAAIIPGFSGEAADSR